VSRAETKGFANPGREAGRRQTGEITGANMTTNNQNGGTDKPFGNQLAEKAALGAAWAVGGAVALGTLGFLLGGPPGAVIGAKLGGLLGGGAGAGGSGGTMS
jgi:hypothetical protein